MGRLGAGSVLAINAPATDKRKTELPGSDPTSLYYALLPLNAQRRAAHPGLNFNEEIFNPKIWDCISRRELELRLEKTSPSFVLISNTTPAHPYALEIADLVRNKLRDTVIILGGPHEDETIRNSAHQHGSTLLDQLERKVSDAVDFVISGDGEYALQSLVNLLAETDGSRDHAKPTFAAAANSGFFQPTPGKATISSIIGGEILNISTSGGRVKLDALPPIYDYFENNSRFSVFPRPDGTLKQTAHIMVTRGCTFNCCYCSESTGTFGAHNSPEDFAGSAVKQLRSALNSGSESAFFEDSVFMWGKQEKILETCKRIGLEFKSEIESGFEWGCQISAETVIQFGFRAEEMLRAMRKAGCSYIFFGIESLNERVMSEVHKNKTRDNTRGSWKEKIGEVLMMARSYGFKTGASVLFGLPGETRESIDETINGVQGFINDGRLSLVSPNIVTYHPGTRLTRSDGMQGKIDYSKVQPSEYPYDFFDEAAPGRTSVRLTSADMEHIVIETTKKWSALNTSKTERKTSGFYDVDSSDSLVHEDSFGPAVSEYLSEERRATLSFLRLGDYDELFEVGCMAARNLDISVEAGIAYGGIDIADRLVTAAIEIISKSGLALKGYALMIPAENMAPGAFPHPGKKPLALFPFNSFGNMTDAESVIRAMSNCNLDLLISTYKTDESTNSERGSYYGRSEISGLRQVDLDHGTKFIGDDGFSAMAYQEGYLRTLLEKHGYNVVVLSLGKIGRGYYCQKATPQ